MKIQIGTDDGQPDSKTDGMEGWIGSSRTTFVLMLGKTGIGTRTQMK